MRQSILRTACAAFLLLTAGAQAGTLEDGLAAFDRQDYPKSLELLRPLAENGSVPAQVRLAVMYKKSLGVAQDYALAAKWFHKAAEQGYPLAQVLLSFMYKDGEGVTQDSAAADEWLGKTSVPSSLK